MLSPNTILQDRYRVVRELGHGGMGTVYEALDQRVNCIVALKETIAGNSDEARRAFEREASLLGNLRHSALPKVMDYFTEDDGDFLIMEFIAGHDLAELLASRGSPFPQSQVLGWADELLKLLEYLHTRQPPILHRDIKPANLKVTDQGEIFLLDFGLAKGSTGQMPILATSRSVFGYTPSYASLEQILGQGTDPRSDLYSLGATLYHLLAGVPPTDAPTRFNAFEDEQPDPLQPIEKVNPQASSGVTAVIHQAMAIARKHRPISAAEMLKALRNAAEEDERHTAEEEYARAEARRQQREDERRRAEAKAATRAEDEQQQAQERKREEARRREAERRRAEEAERRAEEHSVEEAKKRAEEQRLRREAEERDKEKQADAGGRDQVSKTVLASTVRAQEPSLNKQASQPALETIHAPPPDRLSFDQFSASLNAQPEFAPTIAGTSKRNLVIGAVVLVVFAGIAFLIWSLSGKTTGRTNHAGIEFVLIPSGQFMMGSTNGYADGRPVHQVTINYSFDMGKYEVTQKQWQAVMGNNPSNFKDCGGNCPVEQVSWDDALSFINKLNERNDGFRYRLPTEAEWEYACRAGTTGDYAGNLSEMAWYSDNSENKTHAVGGKQPNAWGLADIHGNVLEWCQDWYHDSYNGAPTDGSAWLSGGEQKYQKYRVLRGGSWFNVATNLRSADRLQSTLDHRASTIGFRLVAVVRTP